MGPSPPRRSSRLYPQAQAQAQVQRSPGHRALDHATAEPTGSSLQQARNLDAIVSDSDLILQSRDGWDACSACQCSVTTLSAERRAECDRARGHVVHRSSPNHSTWTRPRPFSRAREDNFWTAPSSSSPHLAALGPLASDSFPKTVGHVTPPWEFFRASLTRYCVKKRVALAPPNYLQRAFPIADAALGRDRD